MSYGDNGDSCIGIGRGLIKISILIIIIFITLWFLI